MAKRRSFGKIRKVPRKTSRGGFALEASFVNPRRGLSGEPHRITRIFSQATSADIWLAGQQTEIERGKWYSPAQLKARQALDDLDNARARKTFGEFAAEWVMKRARRHKESVKRTNDSLLRIHLLPRWEKTPIASITPEDVDTWALLELAPGRPGARRHAYELFRAIMRSAEALKTIDVSPCTTDTDQNVAASTSEEPSQRHKARSLTNAEISGLIDELPRTMVPMFKFMLMTGLRMGEARELRWGDVHEGVCSVTRSVSGDGKALAVRDGTKSASSTRKVFLGPHTVEILDEVRRLQNRPRKGDLIFPSIGDPMKHYSESLFNKNLYRICERIGIDRVSAHDLRHTWADRGGRNAESIKDVQDSLGHTTAAMSLRYMKSSDVARRVLQAAVEDQFTTAIEGASENE